MRSHRPAPLPQNLPSRSAISGVTGARSATMRCRCCRVTPIFFATVNHRLGDRRQHVLTQDGTIPRPARYPANGGVTHMPITRNWLFLLIGALIVAVAALGFKIYQDHREPKGVQLNFGPSGISVQKK